MLKRKTGIFKGYINENGEREIFYNDQPLDPRLDLFNHSRVGIDWGYIGSGALQLSFAILVEALDEEQAKKLRNLFSKEIVSKFEESWEITSKQIKKWAVGAAEELQHQDEHDMYDTHTPINTPVNVVKKACQELNITQKKLAEILEVPEGTVSSWAVRNELPRLAKKAIEFYIEKQKNDQIVKQFRDLIALVS